LSDRSRVEELAQRTEELLADIRAEIEESSLAPRQVGVLIYLEEAASLLNHAGLRMGWWLPKDERRSAKPPESDAAVTAAGVARIVRDVAQTRPGLLPACLWLLVRRPATRLAVGAYSPKPEELAELERLAKP